MFAFRTIPFIASLAILAACTTTAPSQGVGFGPPGGTAQMALVSPSLRVGTAAMGTTAYDDGYMHGTLTVTPQSATLEKIRHHNILDPFLLRSPKQIADLFAVRVAERTGCQVRGVSTRSSDYALKTMTAILNCS